MRCAQVAAHVRDALRMQKPLLLSAVHTAAEAGGGAWGRQRALQAMVARYLARAISLGMPVAGQWAVPRGLARHLPSRELRGHAVGPSVPQA